MTPNFFLYRVSPVKRNGRLKREKGLRLIPSFNNLDGVSLRVHIYKKKNNVFKIILILESLPQLHK